MEIESGSEGSEVDFAPRPRQVSTVDWLDFFRYRNVQLPRRKRDGEMSPVEAQAWARVWSRAWPRAKTVATEVEMEVRLSAEPWAEVWTRADARARARVIGMCGNSTAEEVQIARAEADAKADAEALALAWAWARDARAGGEARAF